MVFNDIRVHKHFDLRMWHCVSDNFEASSLVRSVIELASKDSCSLPNKIELLREKLQDVVGRKRFLLILDDMWDENQHKWDDHLKPILCSSVGGSGSVIVVTSRSQNVSNIMGTIPPHELACLSGEESWILFSKKAFSKGVKEREEFVAVGKRIVDKCKGLPLALKTMGGLMSSKHVVKEWAAVADTSSISDTSRGKDDVLSVLKLSYKYLSAEMKQCFAFCAIFPKDYEMEKDMLIQLWISNHYIHRERITDLIKKGEFIFNELVWRSFLQDVKESPQIYQSDRDCHLHLEIVCKMHDLMHDVAKDVTEECPCIEELIQGKASIKCVRHIAMSNDDLRESKGLLKRASSLRTLLIESQFREELGIKELRLKSLRALHCWRQPSHSLVKYSKYLQYLDLSWSPIFRLPDSICMIYNLQSLRLNWCSNLQCLPEGLATSLKKLSHIYLFGCHNLEVMPPKLSLMHNLCTLTMFVVGTKDGCGIDELKDLQQLSNRLELRELKKVKGRSNANLREKHNLCELSLNWNHKESDILTNDNTKNEEEVLESLVPSSELKVLEVHGYHGLRISQWMRDPQMFQSLGTLIISDWPKCRDIPLIWLSPSLENLHLYHMVNLTTLCKSIDVQAEGCSNFAQAFPGLKSLTLNGLPNLERWTEESRSLMFPKLEELKVAGCPKLATLPEGPLLKQLCCSISNPVYLNSYCSEGFVHMSMPMVNWPSLVRLEVGVPVSLDVSMEEQQAQSPDPLGALRYLSTIGDDAFASIFNIPKLHLGFAGCLAHVDTLHISCSYNIVRWPVEELGYMPRLRSLHIMGCKRLGELGLSSKETLPLPLLKMLIIGHCDSLLEIPLLLSSLEALFIDYCNALVALPSNLGNMARLRDLRLYFCSELKVLPDGMDGLTSLEQLRIEDCPGMTEFPQGLLQRLPSLKLLSIRHCPGLQRCCSTWSLLFQKKMLNKNYGR